MTGVYADMRTGEHVMRSFKGRPYEKEVAAVNLQRGYDFIPPRAPDIKQEA